MKLTFKWKFFILITAILLFTVILFSFIINNYEKKILLKISYEKGLVLSEMIQQNLNNMMESGTKLQLFDFLKSKISNEIKGISIIDLRKEKVLYSNDKDVEGQELDKLIIKKLKTIEGKRIIAIDNLNKRMIYYFIYLGNSFFNEKGKFALKVIYSNDRIYNFIRKQFKQTLYVSIIILILGLIFSIYFGRMIVKPINVLIQGIFAVGEGDLDYKININSQDEFGKLASAFNKMAAKLKNAQKQMIIKELMERDLQLGLEIQNSLFLKELPKTKYDIAAHYEFARVIGGDYYDILKREDLNTLTCLVADVSGKGIPGSLIMVMIRSILRAQYVEKSDLKELVISVNKLLMKDIKPGKFVTLLITNFNEKEDTFETLKLGHLPLYKYDAKEDKVMEINPNGIGLGLNDGVIFETNMEKVSGKINKGDVFLLCTDGVTEAMNKQREEYGEERLKQCLKNNAKYDSKTIIKNIREEILTFLDGEELQDDFTMVVIKY